MNSKGKDTSPKRMESNDVESTPSHQPEDKNDTDQTDQTDRQNGAADMGAPTISTEDNAGNSEITATDLMNVRQAAESLCQKAVSAFCMKHEGVSGSTTVPVTVCSADEQKSRFAEQIDRAAKESKLTHAGVADEVIGLGSSTHPIDVSSSDGDEEFDEEEEYDEEEEFNEEEEIDEEEEADEREKNAATKVEKRGSAALPIILGYSDDDELIDEEAEDEEEEDEGEDEEEDEEEENRLTDEEWRLLRYRQHDEDEEEAARLEDEDEDEEMFDEDEEVNEDEEEEGQVKGPITIGTAGMPILISSDEEETLAQETEQAKDANVEEEGDPNEREGTRKREAEYELDEVVAPKKKKDHDDE